MSQLEIERQELETRQETNLSKAQQNRRILETLLNKHIPDEEIVTHIKQEAFDRHNGWAYQEILNRKYGKVKDIVDVNVNIRDLRPQQEEIEALNNRFKAIDTPYTIIPDDNKTPPEPSNTEQNTVYIEDSAVMRHNASNEQQEGPIYTGIIETIPETIQADIEPVEKTDTFPGDCQAFQAVDQDMQEHITARTLDIIEQASEPDIYSTKSHIIHRNKSI
jgi:hypothetical protein